MNGIITTRAVKPVHIASTRNAAPMKNLLSLLHHSLPGVGASTDRALLVCVALLSAGPVLAASSDFSTDFSGSTLDSSLTADAPGSTTVALDGNGHVNVFTGDSIADIWGANFGGPTVRYAVDENDARSFVLETEITNYRDSGNGSYHAGLIMRFADRTVMWGPYMGDLIKHETDLASGDRSGIDVPDEDIRSIGGADINLKLRIVRSGTSYRLYFQRNSSVAGASPPDADWVLCNIVTHDPGDGQGPQWVGLFSKTWAQTNGDASFNYLSFSITEVPDVPGIYSDFSDGTLQGWQVISQGGGPNALVAASESGRIATGPCLTTSKTLLGGGFTGDNVHAPIIVRSPTFVITNAGWITWTTVGGNDTGTVDPGTGTGPYPAGAMGVTLVEADTGNRIMSDQLTQFATILNKWFDVSSLANLGTRYYLELVDNFGGPWGYAEWDNVHIPGQVVPMLTYNFNDGTMQDWQVISQGGGPNALPSASWNNLLGADQCLSTARTTSDGGFTGDDVHSPIVVRSPTFTINAGATVITWSTVGGSAGGTVDPGTGTDPYPDGAMGVALVEAATGDRIMSDRLNQEDAVGRKSFDVSILADNGTSYYLEVVDNFSGGWGYGEWDDFTIPGKLLPAPQMQVQYAGSFLAIGGTTALGLASPGSSMTRQFVITNLPTAADALHLTGSPVVVLSGDPQFTLTSDVPGAETTLAPGEGTSFAITFEPAVYGSFTAQISIASDDPYKNPYTFTITARSGPLAYYTFDNGGNPWEDSSGNGNDITGDGGTAPTWSATGGFDGSGGYLFNNARLIAPIDADVDVMPKLTWGAWVRTDQLTGLSKFLGTDDGNGDRTVGLDSRGDGWADVGGFRYTSFTGAGGPINNPVTGFAPVNTTDWAFIAVTYDQGPRLPRSTWTSMPPPRPTHWRWRPRAAPRSMEPRTPPSASARSIRTGRARFGSARSIKCSFSTMCWTWPRSRPCATRALPCPASYRPPPARCA